MLLERLRVCGTSDLSDPLVRDKCKVLFRSWAAEYKNTRGLERIAALYKVLMLISQALLSADNDLGTSSSQASGYPGQVQGTPRD